VIKKSLVSLQSGAVSKTGDLCFDINVRKGIRMLSVTPAN